MLKPGTLNPIIMIVCMFPACVAAVLNNRVQVHNYDFIVGLCIFAFVAKQANGIQVLAGVTLSPTLFPVKVMPPIAHDLGIISFEQAGGLQGFFLHGLNCIYNCQLHRKTFIEKIMLICSMLHTDSQSTDEEESSVHPFQSGFGGLQDL